MALKMLCCSALSLALAAPAAAQDQSVATEAAPAPDAREIDFSADRVSYDSAADVIVADGRVRMASDGNHLAADRVTWTRRTGEVVAEGNVVVVNPEGDKLVGERVALTDSLRDGTIENLLVVLDSAK